MRHPAGPSTKTGTQPPRQLLCHPDGHQPGCSELEHGHLCVGSAFWSRLLTSGINEWLAGLMFTDQTSEVGPHPPKGSIWGSELPLNTGGLVRRRGSSVEEGHVLHLCACGCTLRLHTHAHTCVPICCTQHTRISCTSPCICNIVSMSV